MQALLHLSVALFVGLILSRLAKVLKLPAVTAYLVAGILVGLCGSVMIKKIPKKLFSSSCKPLSGKYLTIIELYDRITERDITSDK